MFETLVDVFLDALIDSLKIVLPTSLERLLEKWDPSVR